MFSLPASVPLAWLGRCLGLTGLVISLSACAERTASPHSPPPAPVANLRYSSAYCGDGGAQLAARRLSTAARWHGFYAAQLQMTSPARIEPDFAREELLWISLGSRPTGGYQLQLAGAHRTADRLIVSLTQSAPAAGRFRTQVITSPCVLVSIEQAHDQPIELTGDLPGLPLVLEPASH